MIRHNDLNISHRDHGNSIFGTKTNCVISHLVTLLINLYNKI